MSMTQTVTVDFSDFLKSNRISVSGNKMTHKGKRVGTIEQIEEGIVVYKIFAQFDSFFYELLDGTSDHIMSVVNPQISDNNCPRCIAGKCSVTGIRLSSQYSDEMEFMKKLLILRCEAIDNNRVPKCNYIKVSDRDKCPPCKQ